MSSRPFYRGRGRGFRGGGGFRGGFNYQHYQNQLRQQQLELASQAESEKPIVIPLDPCLNYGEDFRARSQKRRAIIAKALGVKHPDLLHFCLNSPRDITMLRTISHRHQSSLFHRQRTKVAKLKAKEAKKKLAVKTSEPVRISSGTPLHSEDAEARPKDRALTPGLENSDSMRKPDPIDVSKADNASEPDKSHQLDDDLPAESSNLSGGPQNDYSLHFICSGERPANFVRDIGLANRFEEYPKLRDLIKAKDLLIQSTNLPPFTLKADLSTYPLTELGTEFEVVLIEPPLEDYRYMGQAFERYWDWDDIEKLDIGAITAPRSFVWLWVGAGEGLDRGRRCLAKWGFRRCEDIVWVKTNSKRPGHSSLIEPVSVLQRTKEHCLMGIKGTVLRSKDGDFIHANIDLDVIIEEEPEPGIKDKPLEMFHLIEHFCLGRRRLHLFARESTVRPGWVSVGSEIIRSNYDPETYRSAVTSGPGLTTGCTEEIERMRPKTPPALKAAVAAQQAVAAAATGQPVVIQPSPLPPGVLAQSIGAALLQSAVHCESPNMGI